MKKIIIFLCLLLIPVYVWSQPSRGSGSFRYSSSCPTGTCDLASGTTVNATAICLADGTNCSASAGGWTDGGTNVYLTTAGDNVGIGTSVLSSGKLTIKGNGTTTGINTQHTDSASAAQVTILDNGNIGIGSSLPQTKLVVQGTGTTTATNFQIQNSAAAVKMTVLDNGNVGIGTTNPTTVLDVASKVFVDGTQGQLSVGEVPLGSGFAAVLNGSRSGYSVGYISAYSTTAAEDPEIVLKKSHHGTIGTLARTLDGDSLGAFAFNGVDAVPQSRQAASFGVAQLGATATGVPAYIYFGTSDGTTSGPTERMRITPGGNVGISSTVPQARVVVQGTGTTTAPALQVQNSSAAVKFTVLDNGNVGIGSTLPEGNFVVRLGTNDMGWSVISAVNQACNTTCASGCVAGSDGLGVGGFLTCTDATADTCICAGSN